MSAPDNDDRNYLDDDKYLDGCLKIAKQKFEEGNKAVVLMAMHQCLLMNKPIPEWLRLAFIKAYQSAYPFEFRSWDQAFGPPHKEGRHLDRKKLHAELRMHIILRAQQLMAAGAGTGEGLFQTIADELKIKGVGSSTVRNIYYDDHSKFLKEALEILTPRFSKNN